ncbi:MAG: 3'-5' exonuclease, partial [Ktedonobacterales bacterium]
RLLREQPEVLAEVRERFQHVLVDEFQDINRAMGVLLHTLTAFDGALWAVGDADQAIYRFRGASPANLSRFTAEYQAAEVQTLERNYRSMADILEAAAAVAGSFLEGRGDAFARPALTAVRQPASDDSGIVTLASAPNEAAELGRLAEAIRERQALGRKLGDQVVLCRTRRQCQQVAAVLNDAGIPTRLAMPLIEQDAIKDVLAVLSLLSDMSGAGILRAGEIADHAYSREEARAVLAEAQARHISPWTLLLQMAHEDTEVPGLTPDGRRGLATLAAILSELRVAPDVATGLSRYIFGWTQIGRGLLAAQADTGHGVDADIGRQLATSLAQLLTHARAFEEQRRLAERAQQDGADVGPPRTADWGAFLDYLRVVLALRQEGGSAAEELVGDSDARVRVLTVHASKGLEFPVVYLPGLADRRFPMQRRGTSAPMPTHLSEDELLEAQNPNAHLAEEACLFYVAVTRARDELVLSYAEQYGRMRYRPSPFLAPIQQRLGGRLRQIHWTAVPVAHALSSDTTPAGDGEAERAGDEVAPLVVGVGPLRPAAIETYSRCPRQYAYRYVYGLRPREVGLMTLRRTLHDTLHALQERVAQAATQMRSAEQTDSGQHRLSLDEALAIFEQQWEAITERERRTATVEVEEDAAPSELAAPASGTQAEAEWMQPLSQPFVEVYRRHGRQIIERSWARMVQRQLPGMEDISEAGDMDASAPLPEAQYDHPVVVRVGEREITVTLDRVEGQATSRIAYESGSNTSGHASARRERGRMRQADAQPVRFVRHKLGSARAAQADLRALFYALAAEQKVIGSPAEVYDHNLTTGEIERVTLNPRKVAKLREDLDELLEGINSGIYPARPDPNMCLNCPFLFICPA